MKKTLSIVFICMYSFLFCQEKLIEKRIVLQENIEIITDGLDDVVIENSKNNQVEVVLLDENPNTHDILFKEVDETLTVDFNLNFKTFKEDVFRKYITKRLQKASVIIKVPKNKRIVIYGKVIGVTSKSYQGDLSIFIDRGNVQLNKIQGNTNVSLFLGNVFAILTSNNNIYIETTKGKINVNRQVYKSVFSQKSKAKIPLSFNVNSINANVNLIRE